MMKHYNNCIKSILQNPVSTSDNLQHGECWKCIEIRHRLYEGKPWAYLMLFLLGQKV